jgi:hypothetical protein
MGQIRRRVRKHKVSTGHPAEWFLIVESMGLKGLMGPVPREVLSKPPLLERVVLGVRWARNYIRPLPPS